MHAVQMLTRAMLCYCACCYTLAQQQPVLLVLASYDILLVMYAVLVLYIKLNKMAQVYTAEI
jgi:hypothetical protein